MFYSSLWTSDPRYQPSFDTMNVVYPRIYPYGTYNEQMNYIAYAQPVVPSFRNESFPVQKSAIISKAEAELNQVFRMLGTTRCLDEVAYHKHCSGVAG